MYIDTVICYEVGESEHFYYILSFKVCISLANGSPQAWDNVQRVPYMKDTPNGFDRWTSFESQESIRWKVLNFYLFNILEISSCQYVWVFLD